MTDNNRRNLLLGALAAPFVANLAVAAEAAKPTGYVMSHTGRHLSKQIDNMHGTGNEEIGMLIYPGMTALDMIGPQFLFSSMMGAKIYLVAKTIDPVTSDTGVTITPTATFENCPRNLTVLFAPGGTSGTLATLKDDQTLAFMADRGARAKYVTSVCSGSLILGAAGLLKGYKATSHWVCRQVLADFGAIPTKARVVRDRNRITGGGVTAGLDFGLTLVAELRGRTYAECSQLTSEYDPLPPFNAGSPETAPAAVTSAMEELFADFVKEAKAAAAANKSQNS